SPPSAPGTALLGRLSLNHTTSVFVDGWVLVLPISTVTTAEVAWLPAASRATAVSRCVPLVRVAGLKLAVYGAAVSSPPMLPPSNLNCTPATPRLSEAVAATVTEEPERIMLFVGAVIVTFGGVVSPDVPPPPDCVDLPAASQVARPLNS